MSWQIICDFDGTITLEDVTDNVLARFADPAWEEIEAEWKAGRIGSRDCMTRQIDLIRAEPEAFHRHLDAVAIDPGFAPFAAYCHSHGVPLLVVSDGMDYAIRRILDRHGLNGLPVIANGLERLEGERWRLSSPHASQACHGAAGTCKCQVAEQAAKPKRRRTLVIGDGASDICLAGSADLIFAKSKLLLHCRRHGLPHLAFSTFSQATHLLSLLIGAPETFRNAPIPSLETVFNG
ncbi:MAG: MtnX-like HAD-IB family phosphatase [Rhodospirillales bacterium]|nr:MtnX-like HAD-IB family phosphatase [Rhodospirillales bacterium]